MSSIIGKISNIIHHRTGRSGLNQTSNSFKMAAAVVGPFLIAWFAVELFAPQSWRSTATSVGFVGWIIYIFVFYYKLKADVASFIPFPQSQWFYPDGQQGTYDLLVPPKGWEEIAHYQDGSYAYRVNFNDKIEYQEADRPYPDVFNFAIWKLPADWNTSFHRTGHGEFFYKNLFVDHPTCENIALSVIYWDERGASRIPVCLVHSCSEIYNRMLKMQGKKFETALSLSATDAKDLTINDLKHQINEVSTRNKYLEGEAEQYHKEGPEDIIALSDKRIEAHLKRYKTVMNAGKKSWLTKLINGKTLAYALIAIAALLILMHFIMGWP